MFSGSDPTLPILIDVERLDDAQTSSSYSNALGKQLVAVEHKSHPFVTLPTPSPRPCQRLLVVVPDADLREARLAQRVSDMATQHRATVMLLAICSGWADEPQIRLRLALLAALIEGANIAVQSDIIFNEGWPTLLQRLYLPGDLLVCFSEHVLTSAMAGVLQQPCPIAYFLKSMRMPNCELQGYVIALSPHTASGLRGLKTWLLPLGIVVGMLVFQLFLVQWMIDWDDWVKKAVMSISVVAELVSVAYITNG